jgi:hypothetical protein
VDELVDEFAVALFPFPSLAATAFAFTCHDLYPFPCEPSGSFKIR